MYNRYKPPEQNFTTYKQYHTIDIDLYNHVVVVLVGVGRCYYFRFQLCQTEIGLLLNCHFKIINIVTATCNHCLSQTTRIYIFTYFNIFSLFTLSCIIAGVWLLRNRTYELYSCVQ